MTKKKEKEVSPFWFFLITLPFTVIGFTTALMAVTNFFETVHETKVRVDMLEQSARYNDGRTAWISPDEFIPDAASHSHEPSRDKQGGHMRFHS